MCLKVLFGDFTVKLANAFNTADHPGFFRKGHNQKQPVGKTGVFGDPVQGKPPEKELKIAGGEVETGHLLRIPTKHRPDVFVAFVVCVSKIRSIFKMSAAGGTFSWNYAGT